MKQKHFPIGTVCMHVPSIQNLIVLTTEITLEEIHNFNITHQNQFVKKFEALQLLEIR